MVLRYESEIEIDFKDAEYVNVAAKIPEKIACAILGSRLKISDILCQGLYYLLEMGILELPNIKIPELGIPIPKISETIRECKPHARNRWSPKL